MWTASYITNLPDKNKNHIDIDMSYEKFKTSVSNWLGSAQS